MSDSPRGAWRRVALLVTGGAAALLAFGLFSMTVHNRAHNEQMYVAAAYLLTQGERLYEDFAFVQMPYSPLVYALVYSVSGGGYYLLKAKLVNFLWMALAAGLLFVRGRRAANDTLMALILLVFYFANYYLLRAAIEASNYAMPIALALLAYWLWLRGAEGRMNYPLAAGLAGLALAGAVGAKLYYATLALPFGVALLIYPRGLSLRRRLSDGLLPLAAGGVIGLLPVLSYALRDWTNFAFNNLGYHLVNAQWRVQNGFQDTLGLKLDTARDLLANPNFLAWEMWLAAALLILWRGRRWGWPAPGVLLGGLAAVTALVTAFTPTPLFPQYFAMPVPFFLVWMAELYGEAEQPARGLLVRLALIAAIFAILPVWPRHTATWARFFAADDPWSGMASVAESHAIRRAIDQQMGEASVQAQAAPPKLATLSPILALESQMGFYPELATGSFLLRVGDLLTEAERARYVAASPSTLAAVLAADPPAAILIGDEGDAETPLRQFAEEQGYVRADLELTFGELWLRPR